MPNTILTKPLMLDETGQAIAEAIAELTIAGTTDHRELQHRDAADQHPIGAITGLAALIPSDAAAGNKLVTAEEMGDAIASVEAKQLYKTAAQGSFATKAELTAAETFYNAAGEEATPTVNDVAYVLADETHDGKAAKYVAAAVGPLTWGFVITFSNTSFSQAQMDAINSGVTAAKREGYDSHVTNSDIHVTAQQKTNWNNKQSTAITDAGGYFDSDTVEGALQEIGAAMDNTEELVFTLEDDTTVTLNVVVKAVSGA